jgi:2-oxoisovalerate dehydrogenase E1 component
MSSEDEREVLLRLYRHMSLARRSDEAERDLVRRGDANFHLACSGHEAMAAFGEVLTDADWLHLHYRDKALMIARGLPVERWAHALLNTSESCSHGRQMAPFVSDPGRHVLAQNIPVGNHALQAVGVAAAVKDRPGRPIVLCTMGDGATQEGEVLEAIAEVVRRGLPVLFVVEDNGYAISTPTAGRTFYSLPGAGGAATSVFGLTIERCDGRDPVSLTRRATELVARVRESRQPALAVATFERLSSHTNADDERVYRSDSERRRAREQGDPLPRLAGYLVDTLGVHPDALARIDAEVDSETSRAVSAALRAEDPAPVFTAKSPAPEAWGRNLGPEPTSDAPVRTMVEAIRDVLRDRLASDERVCLIGQDIDDPKGDVFGVTRGLGTSFPGRVENAALAESTIVGTAIGRALAGQRPVAFVQFADFLPVAFNQIASELGSIYWRTNGGWSCPVVLMVACGAFRPGLGPFHAQTYESVLSHVPGLDVVMPSNAEDAAGLLQAAFAGDRPTVFLYPKSLLNDPDRGAAIDPATVLVAPGSARHLRRGDGLTLVTWGSTVRQAEQAADAIVAQSGIGVDLIDLRTLSPWDADTVCESARRTGRLIVVHEDNLTCGFGAEVVATVAERIKSPVVCRRVARADTYVPCHFGNQLEVLPSYARIVSTAAEVLGLDLDWKAEATERSHTSNTGNRQTILAHGPSPADETVRVVAWLARPGDTVAPGQAIAEMEADKAVFELVAPTAGRIVESIAAPGVAVRVGEPLLTFESRDLTPEARSRLSREVIRTPRLTRRTNSGARSDASRSLLARVGIAAPSVALGSRIVSNDEIVAHIPGRTGDDIVKRTGIRNRRRLAEGETALSLAVSAAREALARDEHGGLDRIDALICCTTTPQLITPSMACLILHDLCAGGPVREIPAHDVIAACCGYLYALSAAYDFTRSRPGARVLVVSAEALSTVCDPTDFDTAPIFGDAATATIVSGPSALPDRPFGLLHRPVTSARGEPGKILRVPAAGTGQSIHMNGLQVYSEAVRQMIAHLKRACDEAGVEPNALDLIVPHQANARIIDDVRRRLGVPPERMAVELGEVGNTSSSSIPLVLAGLAGHESSPKRVGLTAFGGGYTFAAGILELS